MINRINIPLNNDLSIDQITWNPTDFKAMNEKGVEVTAPTEIGTYTSWQLTKSGLAKLAARTNYLFTIVQTSDVYTIKQNQRCGRAQWQ